MTVRMFHTWRVPPQREGQPTIKLCVEVDGDGIVQVDYRVLAEMLLLLGCTEEPTP